MFISNNTHTFRKWVFSIQDFTLSLYYKSVLIRHRNDSDDAFTFLCKMSKRYNPGYRKCPLIFQNIDLKKIAISVPANAIIPRCSTISRHSADNKHRHCSINVSLPINNFEFAFVGQTIFFNTADAIPKNSPRLRVLKLTLDPMEAQALSWSWLGIIIRYPNQIYEWD